MIPGNLCAAANLRHAVENDAGEPWLSAHVIDDELRLDADRKESFGLSGAVTP